MTQFEYGMLVKYKGDVYVVWDSTKDNKGIIGLMGENTNNIILVKTKEVKVLKPVVVEKGVLRQFFRLEKNMWELAKEGNFPISQKQKRLKITEDDLAAFCKNVLNYEGFTMDSWTEYFIGNELAYTNDDSQDHLSLKMLWHIFRDTFGWFDTEEDDLDYFIEWYKAYLKNKDNLLSNCKLNRDQKLDIVQTIYSEYVHNKRKISDEKRKAYIKYLDELVKVGSWWAQDHKAYACYGGNGLIECNWKESERLLLLLMRKSYDKSQIANSLGYIYYSNRLGKPDYEKAFKYFSIAVKNNVIEAKYKLADMYRKGHGVNKNVDKAFSIYKDLYDRFLPAYKEGNGEGLADIALRMGYCYESGDGVPKDIKKARQFFRQAKTALKRRQKYGGNYGDDIVQKNIEDALERTK